MDKAIKKAITWNLLATGVTLGVSYAITRRLDVSCLIGLSERVIKIGLYILHEKMWDEKKFDTSKCLCPSCIKGCCKQIIVTCDECRMYTGKCTGYITICVDYKEDN